MTKKLAFDCAVARRRADANVRRLYQMETTIVAIAAAAEIMDMSNSTFILGIDPMHTYVTSLPKQARVTMTPIVD